MWRETQRNIKWHNGNRSCAFLHLGCQSYIWSKVQSRSCWERAMNLAEEWIHLIGKRCTYRSAHQLSDPSSLGTSLFRRGEAKDISWICLTMFTTCCLSSCSPRTMVNALDASMCDYHISWLYSTGHAEFLCRTTLQLQTRVEKCILCAFSRSLLICDQKEGLRGLRHMQWILEVAGRVEHWMLARALTRRKPKTLNMAHFVVSDAKHMRFLLNVDEFSMLFFHFLERKLFCEGLGSVFGIGKKHIGPLSNPDRMQCSAQVTTPSTMAAVVVLAAGCCQSVSLTGCEAKAVRRKNLCGCSCVCETAFTCGQIHVLPSLVCSPCASVIMVPSTALSGLVGSMVHFLPPTHTMIIPASGENGWDQWGVKRRLHKSLSATAHDVSPFSIGWKTLKETSNHTPVLPRLHLVPWLQRA